MPKTILAVIADLRSALPGERRFAPMGGATIGLTLMVLSAIVLGVLYPGAVQYFSVRPDEPLKERPYIERNIAATRAAYGITEVKITDYSARTTAEASQLRADAEALPGIRLIDPNVVGPAYEQLQQVRGYYSFPRTLDVDRYTIDGTETDAVVGCGDGSEWHRGKELEQPQDRLYTWLRPGGGVRPDGQSGGEPEWIAKDIPPTGKISEHEPRIYFGEIQGFLDRGCPGGEPAVELDTPGGGDGGNPKTYTYTGKGGVPVGNLWNRLLYAAKFGDVNMLLSDRVNSASKIIYDRTPRERVEKAAPWLTVDGDAYPAVVEGRVKWIVDGYTTSNSYPYSNRVALNEVTADAQTNQGTVAVQARQDVNYIRNSVKAVVDAYDGTVTLYAWDEDDPVLKTWRKAFPTVVQPKSAITADLRHHLRYPQDLFKVQRQVLGRYHVTNPDNWYQNTSLGDSEGPDRRRHEQHLGASVLLDQMAGDRRAIDLLADYGLRAEGKVQPGRLLCGQRRRQQSGLRPAPGPANVRQQPDRRARPVVQRHDDQREGRRSVAPFLNQGASSAAFGNLLTLPVGGGLLYVTPVYTQRQGSTGSYPALRFVVVRFGQEVGIGDTLQQALDEVFGESGVWRGRRRTRARACPHRVRRTTRPPRRLSTRRRRPSPRPIRR